MLRKTTAAVVLAGALALGTASATSLGTFDDVSFAASDVGLQDCEVAGVELFELLPDIPDVGETLTYGGSTFQLTALDLTVLTDATNGLAPECLTGTILEVVLLDGSGAVLDIIEVDPDADDLTNVTPNAVLDIVQVADVRAVLSDAA